VKLPPTYPTLRCSGRDRLCNEQLNDVWVSVTSGSEDYSFKVRAARHAAATKGTRHAHVQPLCYSEDLTGASERRWQGRALFLRRQCRTRCQQGHMTGSCMLVSTH